MLYIDTETGRFRRFDGPAPEAYAIFSHAPFNEQDRHYSPEHTYQHVLGIQLSSSPQDADPMPCLPPLIQSFCTVARNEGFRLAWIDLCCMDDTAQAEEVHARFNWYRRAGTCYVFVDEVESTSSHSEQISQLLGSKWFSLTRTLQEFLAPNTVRFLSSDFTIFGSKFSLARDIEKRTGIDSDILTLRTQLDDVPVARKMSWASLRTEHTEEDMAYWLMGIFDVHMQTMYGEGLRSAFIRLQKAVQERFPLDPTILAWGHLAFYENSGLSITNVATEFCSTALGHAAGNFPQQDLFASSPKDFEHWSASLHCLAPGEFSEALKMLGDPRLKSTSFSYNALTRGEINTLPLIKRVGAPGPPAIPSHIVLLPACTKTDGKLLGLLLRPESQNTITEYTIGGVLKNTSNIVAPDVPLSRYMRAILVDVTPVSKLGWKGPHIEPVRIPPRVHRAPSDIVMLHSKFSVQPRTAFAITASCATPAPLPDGPVPVKITRCALNLDIASKMSDAEMIAVNAGNKCIATIGVGHCRDTCSSYQDQETLSLLISRGEGIVGRTNDEDHLIRTWTTCGDVASREIVAGNLSFWFTIRKTDLDSVDGKPTFHIGIEILPVECIGTDVSPSVARKAESIKSMKTVVSWTLTKVKLALPIRRWNPVTFRSENDPDSDGSSARAQISSSTGIGLS